MRILAKIKNKILKNRFKAGVMQYAIGIALLNLLVIMSYITFIQLKCHELDLYKINLQLQENIYSLVQFLEENPQYLITNNIELPYQKELSNYSNEVSIKEWGVFNIAIITSKYGEIGRTKIFLFADNIFRSTLLPSLYLSSPKSFLSISGKTYLGNNTYLPGYGIKDVSNEGNGYTRERLVHGKSYNASNQLPTLKKNLLDRINFYQQTDSLIPINYLNRKTSISNSFINKTILFISEDPIILQDISLTGNIKIISKKRIEVAENTELDGMILYAPEIEIKKGFCGNGQFYAEKVIETEADCNFKASSLFYLNNLDMDAQINIGERNQIIGDIIIPNKNSETALILGEDDHFIGQVYCNGDVMIKGTFFGSLFTKGLISIDKRGKKLNFLDNICIDVERLPREFAGCDFFEKESKKKCIDELF